MSSDIISSYSVPFWAENLSSRVTLAYKRELSGFPTACAFAHPVLPRSGYTVVGPAYRSSMLLGIPAIHKKQITLKSKEHSILQIIENHSKNYSQNPGLAPALQGEKNKTQSLPGLCHSTPLKNIKLNPSAGFYIH